METASAEDTATAGNDLASSEGLQIFGKPAQTYSVQSDLGQFEHADPQELKQIATIMKAPKDGICFDSVTTHDRIDDTTRLAILTPAKVRCEYDGGDAIPASSLVGLQVDGTFRPFTSSEPLVSGDGPRRIYDITTDGTNAYWLETESASLYNTWRLFGADLQKGYPRLLLTAEFSFGLGGPLPASDQPNLTYHDGRLYFVSSFPTDQYYLKEKSEQLDPESWEPGDFTQGIVAATPDMSDLSFIAESVSHFGFTDQHIAYVKTATSDTTFIDDGGVRTKNQRDIARSIVIASEGSEGSEEILVEDLGSADGSFHEELRISNFRTDGNVITFTRASTAYVLDVETRAVTIVDLAEVVGSVAESASAEASSETGSSKEGSAATDSQLAEDPARILDLIHADGRLAAIVEPQPSEPGGRALVTYDLNDRSGKVYPPVFRPYSLEADQSQITFRIDDGDITTHEIPN